MPERKAAIIDVSKGLLTVSLTTLAAIGGATANAPLAGIATFTYAMLASSPLKPLFEKKQEEHLVLSVPHWWTREPQYESWQAVCSSIESHLPAILKGVEESLRKQTDYPSSSTVNHLFMEQVAQHLSAWEVGQQDRHMVAAYVTPLLLKKTSEVLKASIDTTRQDTLAQWMTDIANKLDTIQQATATITLPSSVAPVIQTIGSPQDTLAITTLLEKKIQAHAYDVYICYDEEDEAGVMKIGEQLKTWGILPWFDAVDVLPGAPRRLQQEEQIRKIASAAVFIGQHAIKREQLIQIYTFISQYISRECLVIPVLLPDAPKKPDLPPFLAEFGWVDFRKQTPNPLKQLLWGISGVRL